ncbi:MAG: hypothetical protein ABI867_09830 [Kofleriaceae bacterium]
MLRKLGLAIVLLAVTMGHDHGGCSSDGEPSGATCPPDSQLTWESFGRDFMAEFCTRCHAAGLQGGQRRGAPIEHDFDSQAGVQLELDHVDAAAAGSVLMPPSSPRPSPGERRQLAEWLACGAP